jgi:hypothetical protein
MISDRFRDVLTAGPGILVCLVGASVLFWEWFRIWAVADPKEIASYFFGSESMVAHGGWKYRSAATYAWSSFVEGTLGLLPIVMFVRAVQQGSRKKTILAYVVMAMIYLAIAFV